MAAETGSQVHFKTPAFKSDDKIIDITEPLSLSTDGERKGTRRQDPVLRKRNPRSLHLAEGSSSQQSLAAAHNVIRGSFAQALTTPRGSLDLNALEKAPVPSPRVSTSHLQLEHLLQAVDADLDGYGLEESRDGFIDASFSRPLKRDADLMSKAAATLPDAFRKKNHPLSLRRFIPQQLREAKAFFRRITSSRSGVRLLKSFLGFFLSYIICLIPASRDWLGKYNYIMVVSALFNHSGRAIGSQLDGFVSTIVGTIAGLGWGSLALYASTSTATAQVGYGGVLATFLVIFAAVIGWLRCVFIRLFQALICAGVAIVYVCLADTSESVGWKKVFDYGIPWALGQAVCFIVAILVFPDAGSRSLA